MPLKCSERQALTRCTNVAFSNTRTAFPERTPYKRGTYCKRRSQKSASHHCRVLTERQEVTKASPRSRLLVTGHSRIWARREWQLKANCRKLEHSLTQLGQLSIRLIYKCRKLPTTTTIVLRIDKRWPFQNYLILLNPKKVISKVTVRPSNYSSSSSLKQATKITTVLKLSKRSANLKWKATWCWIL